MRTNHQILIWLHLLLLIKQLHIILVVLSGYCCGRGSVLLLLLHFFYKIFQHLFRIVLYLFGPELGMLLQILVQRLLVRLLHLHFVQLVVVGELRTRFRLEVRVVFDGRTANVAHGGAARTVHHVAALLLVEASLALVADADHRLVYSVLDACSHVHLVLLLHFVAAQRQMIGLFARPTRLLEAFGILAGKDALICILNYCRIVAVRTKFEVVNAGALDLLALAILEHLAEHVGLKQLANDGQSELFVAPLVETLERVLGVAYLHAHVSLDALLAKRMLTGTADHVVVDKLVIEAAVAGEKRVVLLGPLYFGVASSLSLLQIGNDLSFVSNKEQLLEKCLIQLFGILELFRTARLKL